VEVHVDETLVSVHINPYFLRLNFSNPLVEDDSSSAQYDPSSGHLTLSLSKKNAGQPFEDLDLLAKLLAPRPTIPQPVIEVISGDTGVHEYRDLIAQTEALSLEHDEILQGMINKSYAEQLRRAENIRGSE
jgi:protein SHQ1